MKQIGMWFLMITVLVMVGTVTAAAQFPLARGTGDKTELTIVFGAPTAAMTPDSPDTPEKLPTGISADWWAAVQKNIREGEYQITWQDQTALSDLSAAYQAPNRAQNLRTYFTTEGIRVIPRTVAVSSQGEAYGESWEWGLQLTGYGVSGQVQPVVPAIQYVVGNRIEYRRGPVTEWYVNDVRGLEQGFTIATPPPFLKESAPLVLELAVTGTVRPQLADDGAAIEFLTENGVVAVRYSDLHVTDAVGRVLPAWFETAAPQRSLRILVQAARAQYPVTIDPLVTTPSWTAEGNQTSAYFGFSVGTAGDVNGDGYADVIVGAIQYDNGQTDEGRAYVYHGSAAGLSTTANWTAEGDQDYAYFGISVGTAGNVNGDGYADVIIGAYLYDNGETDEGRAYVYYGSGSGLNPTPNWTAESNQANAYFGVSVGAAGDVNGDGVGDVIVGAYFYDNGQIDEGRAYVYHGSTKGVSTIANWTAESNQANAYFGVSVGTAGDVNKDGYADVIVGAWWYDNGETDEGRAYVYHGSTGGLNVTSNWTAEGNQNNSRFGISVGTAGDVNGDGYADVIVGAYLYDNGETDEGRAYVYHGSSGGLNATANWTAESNQVNADFGISVGAAGDVNKDGYADVIVGAYLYDNVQWSEGRAYVYDGSVSGLNATAYWTAESDQDDAFFGRWVGTAGDVNGDGYADVIVGANQYDNGQTDEGGAFVYQSEPAEVYLLWTK